MIFEIRNPRLRAVLRKLIPFVLMPLTILAGMLVFPGKSYAVITVVVTVEALVLFCAGFEKKLTGTRRMVIIAVMTALSILGRFIFAAIPGFKPITAIVVITAVWLGGESGFLVGALTALVSNFYFGQGPWTPLQMLSFGLIGLIAGFLSESLKKSRILLAVYGIFAGIFYSCLMDVWTVIWYDNTFRWSMYGAAIVTAIPYMFSYALSNVVFLLLLGRPFGEKLARIKLKYGL